MVINSACGVEFSLYLRLVPWEPKTFIFKGYDPYIEGLKPLFFMVLGSKGSWYSSFPLFLVRRISEPSTGIDVRNT